MAGNQQTPTAVDNYMTLEFSSRSENESLARVSVASFAAQLDPTLDQLTELKTAVSEAVTNAIIHGYESNEGKVRLECSLYQGTIEVLITDFGAGIADVEEARQPLFTSRPELERSGMGITIMENFVDELVIDSNPGQGTRVLMRKFISEPSQQQ
ncbi:anti-sigma F factor [Alicyclobacillus sp. SO9]|uniref:anti-sigma F factor n=1 Tax=Alicyclobacillus sp. SO9 TaxID=2665646 RepID=UPI0018E7B5D9|nr:anti-sigma F factor [Alicyclobacillus sp. SO9]QQE76912.1 anti-sigma F factor [Alicyclobacillus sp. SO9]